MLVNVARDSSSVDSRFPTMEALNSKVFYRAALQVGTPPQHVEVILDSGSSDLWLPQPGTIRSSNTSQVSWTQSNQSQAIYFDTDDSSSFRSNNSDFFITYRDGSTAAGTWGTDTISFGSDWTVENVSFATVNQTNATMGILGLGLPGIEATVDFIGADGEPHGTYSNFPMLLKEQGLISRVSYSLWLNSANASSGSLIFGGIDHSKYEGDLFRVPLIRTYQTNNPITTSIMLHGIGSHEGDLVDCSLPVLLDSGATMSYLPQPFVSAIGSVIKGRYDEENNIQVCSCNNTGELLFNFSGITIKLDLATTLFPLFSTDGDFVYDSGQQVCALPFVSTEDNFVLGDNVLRAAYLVFDYENYEVGLAQAVHGSNQTSEDLKELSTGIPAAQAPYYSSTASTTSYTAHLNISSMEPFYVTMLTTSTVSSYAVSSTSTAQVANAAVIPTCATALSIFSYILQIIL